MTIDFIPELHLELQHIILQFYTCQKLIPAPAVAVKRCFCQLQDEVYFSITTGLLHMIPFINYVSAIFALFSLNSNVGSMCVH